MKLLLVMKSTNVLFFIQQLFMVPFEIFIIVEAFFDELLKLLVILSGLRCCTIFDGFTFNNPTDTLTNNNPSLFILLVQKKHLDNIQSFQSTKSFILEIAQQKCRQSEIVKKRGIKSSPRSASECLNELQVHRKFFLSLFVFSTRNINIFIFVGKHAVHQTCAFRWS